MSASEVNTVQAKEEQHPLVGKKLNQGGSSFSDWKENWDEEMAREWPRASVLMGLIHSLGASSCIRTASSVGFLLELADGHTDWFKFRDRDTRRFNRDQAELKRGVAIKAFNILCDRFFKNTNRTHDDPSWSWFVVELDDLVVLLKFFRTDEKRQSLENLPCRFNDKRHHAIIVEFLKWFCEDVWKQSVDPGIYHWGGGDRHLSREFKEECARVRPQIVGILSCIGSLDTLLSFGEVDKESREVLRELAIYSLDIERIHDGRCLPDSLRTVEYAATKGNKAAQILILLANKRRQEVLRKEIEEEFSREAKDRRRKEKRGRLEIASLRAKAALEALSPEE